MCEYGSVVDEHMWTVNQLADLLASTLVARPPVVIKALASTATLFAQVALCVGQRTHGTTQRIVQDGKIVGVL